jgi:hypothetical protein
VTSKQGQMLQSEKSGQPTASKIDLNVKVTEMERGNCSEDSGSTEHKYQNVTYSNQ